MGYGAWDPNKRPRQESWESQETLGEFREKGKENQEAGMSEGWRTVILVPSASFPSRALSIGNCLRQKAEIISIGWVSSVWGHLMS